MIADAIKSIVRAYSRTLHPFVPKGAKPLMRKAYSAAFGGLMQKSNEDEIFGLYSKMGIIRKGDLVFDVGANRGNMAAVFVRLGAKVVCAEPDPRCVEMLKKRFGSNPSVAIVEAGLGESEGELELNMGTMDGNATFSEEFARQETEHYSGDYVMKKKVRVTTLDSLIEKHGCPDYCKVDVEGFERQVFAGLSHGIKCVSFEYHRESLEEATDCAKKLQSLGATKFNYTHYVPGRPPFEQEWAGLEKTMASIESEEKDGLVTQTGDINTWKTGDIYSMTWVAP